MARPRRSRRWPTGCSPRPPTGSAGPGIFASTTFAFPGTELYRYPKDFVALGTPAQAKELHEWEQEVAGLSDRHEKLKNEVKRVQQAPGGTLNGRTVKQVEDEFAAVKA